LEEITRPLVTSGMREIESLLDSVGVAPAQVSRCLVVGGMAAMPVIRSRLHELFGPERVRVPGNSGTLVSQGAAWIAHDSQPLVLAKRIELEMARGSRLPLLRAGTPMPVDGDVRQETLHLYCTDPSDGTAKFPIVVPTQLSEQPQASDERTVLGMVTVAVDKTAPPLTERLELDITMDDDLILSVAARSSQRKDAASESYFDLEFGIGLPGSADPKARDAVDPESAAPTGGLTIRANVADQKDQSLIPGDVLYRHNSRPFQRLPGPDQATEEQLREHLYYRPCSGCKRPWGDPRCRCASR
jgi:molecular chaperone DnaK